MWLSTALTAKAVVVANMASGLGGCGTPNLPDDNVDTEEEKDTVVLKLNHKFLDLGLDKMVMATEAIKLIGRLLSLALWPTMSDVLQAADTNGGGPPRPRFCSGNNPNPAMEYTPFAWAVLVFLAEMALMVMWDAEEGTFPVLSAFYPKWEEEEINSDVEEEDTSKDPAAWEIEVLCKMDPFVD